MHERLGMRLLPPVPRRRPLLGCCDREPRADQLLGVSIEEQLSWRDEYAALRGWRGAFEQHDLLVFQFEIRGGELRGFSAWDDRAPLAVVNSSAQSPLARTFTMAHELGHLVTRTDASCIDRVAPTGR
jgi:Zn-dependent peptidase ImmA (M78 family)